MKENRPIRYSVPRWLTILVVLFLVINILVAAAKTIQRISYIYE